MRQQDIAVLFKILCYHSRSWYNKDLAKDLYLSPAEISNSLQRSAFSGLLDTDKKNVRVQALLDFLIYGFQYVFPQRPGNISRGIATAHSHPFMKTLFNSDQIYVWPDANGEEKGLSVPLLYPGVVDAAKHDEQLYLMLALTDVLRLGKTREKAVAINKLKELFNQ